MAENGRFGDLSGARALMWETIGNDTPENSKAVCHNWFTYVELYTKDLIDKHFLKTWLGKSLVARMTADNIFRSLWPVKQTKLEPNRRVKSKNATVDESVVSGDPPSDVQTEKNNSQSTCIYTGL